MQNTPPSGPGVHDPIYRAERSGGRICDLESTPQARRLALAFALVLFFMVVVLVKAAIGFVIEAETTRPAACAGLSVHECAARAEEGW